MSRAINKGGRPPKLYQCITCKVVLSVSALRSHKCNPSSGNAESGK